MTGTIGGQASDAETIQQMTAIIDYQARQIERLRTGLESFGRLMPSMASLDNAPDNRVISFFANLGELRAVKAFIAAERQAS